MNLVSQIHTKNYTLALFFGNRSSVIVYEKCISQLILGGEK